MFYFATNYTFHNSLFCHKCTKSLFRGKFIDAYFKYNNDIAEICKECDISRATYYNYLKDAKIKKEISNQLNEILRDTTNYLKSNLKKCCITLMDIVDSKETPPQVKINAINSIMSNTAKLNEQTDVLDKLQAIEEHLNINNDD